MEGGVEAGLRRRAARHALLLLALLLQVVHVDVADLEGSLADVDLPEEQFFVCDGVAGVVDEAEVGVEPLDDEVVFAEYGCLLLLGGLACWLHGLEGLFAAQVGGGVVGVKALDYAADLGDVLDSLELLDLQFPHVDPALAERQLRKLDIGEAHPHNFLVFQNLLEGCEQLGLDLGD